MAYLVFSQLTVLSGDGDAWRLHIRTLDRLALSTAPGPGGPQGVIHVVLPVWDSATHSLGHPPGCSVLDCLRSALCRLLLGPQNLSTISIQCPCSAL